MLMMMLMMMLWLMLSRTRIGGNLVVGFLLFDGSLIRAFSASIPASVLAVVTPGDGAVRRQASYAVD
jgi:uncharacterized membrane protein